MRSKYVAFLIFIHFTVISFGQQPFEEYGYKVKVATLSGGKFLEFFDQDSLVEIGSVVLNVNTGKIVGFVTYDTVYRESDLQPEIISRWISPDPHSDKYTDVSPYNFVLNNPVRLVDVDGRDPREGNEVLKVDLSRSYVVAFHGERTGVLGSDKYDAPLYKKATHEYIEHAGPSPGGLPTKALEIVDGIGGVVDMSIDKAGRAAAWQEASMRSGGYDYVEQKEDNSSVYRQVRNLNEKLGVESGFENVVEGSISFNKEGKVESMTAWHYGTVVDEKTGQKTVYAQSITFNAQGKVLSTSGYSVQIPDQKKPKEDKK